LVLTALGAGAFLALGRDGARANPDPIITVNSTADTNARDSVMTLREAILLAKGDDASLHMPGLTPAECAQISTAFYDSILGCLSVDPPGAASADTIVFDAGVFPPASPATITIDPGLVVLPTLEGDTVEGSSAGVILTGMASCLILQSDNTIKGLQIYNCNYGLYVSGDNNTIGGSAAAERNVISGSTTGVLLRGGLNNAVKGNYIGTDAAGAAAVPNTVGVEVYPDSHDNIIGGSTEGERNVISGNSVGVSIFGPSSGIASIKGNYIGTNAAGTAAIPNFTGVEMYQGAQDNTIGGTAAGEGNLIAFNTGDGVRVSDAATTGNTIRGNSIHSNGGKGIENVLGGNTELTPPVITGFGSVMGTACPNCTIDIYSDDEDEGRVYEGSTTADNGGDWTFDGSPEGPNVTATATDPPDTLLDTSEFSAPVEVPEATPTPSPTPTSTATPGATATPPSGPTRTLEWGLGWNNASWSGPDGTAPQDVFACAAGRYAAAYRFVNGGLERFFPDRPDISNMGPLNKYNAFLILITAPVTCIMPVSSTSGATAALQWGLGWNNSGWSGADGTAPGDAFACADGGYAAAYRYVAGGLERFFPARPDISNMAPLNKYDAFLILLSMPVTCTPPVGP
jgi:CSLREA domain-containing protein